jgi:uncharacterized protein with ATP-grasp and redox domains
MQSSIDCVHCYLKQAVTCMNNAGIPENKQYNIIYPLMDYVKTYDIRLSPAVNSTLSLLKCYELIENEDPYREAKKESNDAALRLFDKLAARIRRAQDPLYEALKVSVAGNVIDLGINREYDIDAALEDALRNGFAKNDYQLFREKLDTVDWVLILGDNAGEIVFDRLLARELSHLGKRVVYTVKGGPILNDATMEDAVYVGMDQDAEVVSTGSNYLGVHLESSSKEFLDLLKEAPLIIGKGHANFETLEDADFARERIFFLLKIKCDVVGKTAGANLGDLVFFTRRL